MQNESTEERTDPGPLGPVPPELARLDGDPSSSGAKLPTLDELGKRFPTGFVDADGTKHADFEVVDWNYAVEESLGEISEKDRKINLATYMSEVIAAGLTRVGTIDVRELKRSQRRLLVRRLFFADALYAYVWVRIAAEGVELKLKDVECDRCGYEIPKFSADLRTIEVKTFDEVPEGRVELEHGVEFAGKRLKVLKIAPVRWAMIEDNPGMFSNAAKLKLAMISSGVVGIEGAPAGPTFLTAEHLRTMRTREINRVVSEIDALGGGPVMQVSDRCPKCGDTFTAAIPWTYDVFFASSSR